MTVKEILVVAAGMLGRTEVAGFLESGVGTDVKALENERTALVRCYNLIESEMALDYRPLRYCEAFTSDNGYIAYSALTKRPIEVEKVLYSGASVPFTAQTEGVKTKSGAVEIVYRFAPARKTAEDESDYSEREARALALGVACE